MKRNTLLIILFLSAYAIVVVSSCHKNPVMEDKTPTAIEIAFKDKIDINHPLSYSAQFIPGYITKSNGMSNPVSDKGATLCRVLFYDKQLSVNNTIACGSCHQQQFAFSDTAEPARV